MLRIQRAWTGLHPQQKRPRSHTSAGALLAQCKLEGGGLGGAPDVQEAASGEPPMGPQPSRPLYAQVMPKARAAIFGRSAPCDTTRRGRG